MGEHLLASERRAAELLQCLLNLLSSCYNPLVFLEELNIYRSLFCKMRASKASGFDSAVRVSPRAGCLPELLLEVPCQTPLPGSHQAAREPAAHLLRETLT